MIIGNPLTFISFEVEIKAELPVVLGLAIKALFIVERSAIAIGLCPFAAAIFDHLVYFALFDAAISRLSYL